LDQSERFAEYAFTFDSPRGLLQGQSQVGAQLLHGCAEAPIDETQALAGFGN